MNIARIVLYLRKQLVRQPIAVSGAGAASGGGGVGSPIGLLLTLTQAS